MTGKARNDKRYEQLNREHAESHSTFRNVAQLWDKPLFMIGTVSRAERRGSSSEEPSHYFCDIDGYQEQRIGVTALPSAVVPRYDILTHGQRVVIRMGL